METYQSSYGKQAVPLFALDPKGKLNVFFTASGLVPGPGWTLIGLVSEDTPDS